MDWAARIDADLGSIRGQGRWRTNAVFDARGPVGCVDGREVVSFASNDYLGLSTHPAVVDAAHGALDRWGAGATASRLVVGTRPVHAQLETALAEWRGTEAALVFPSGYQANLGVLTTLGGAGVTIFSDEANHASIIDGCRLARADVVVYRHRDVGHLAESMAVAAGPRVVVSDAVFSMDGDEAPVAELAELCAHHDAVLVLDEAHAVLGPHVGDVGCELVRIGTLSKALGSQGGFVAARQAVIDLLVNRARSFIFTTGLGPVSAAAALAALNVTVSAEGVGLKRRLAAAVERARPGCRSPILPVVVGSEAAAVAASAALAERGLWVPAIRPPTVPEGTSRLRIALSAAHTGAMVDQLVEALAATGLGPAGGESSPALL
ncbi:MAG: 8-amino-7-oxononanoate synthase [Acidimicrobiales bacterium]